MSDRSIHGRAVTCTECGLVIGIDLATAHPDDLNDYVFPTNQAGTLVHPDGSRCDMGAK